MANEILRVFLIFLLTQNVVRCIVASDNVAQQEELLKQLPFNGNEEKELVSVSQRAAHQDVLNLSTIEELNGSIRRISAYMKNNLTFIGTSYSNNNIDTLKLAASSRADAIRFYCHHHNISDKKCRCPDIDLHFGKPIFCVSRCHRELSSDIRVIGKIVISILGILGNVLVIVARIKYWNPSPHFLMIIGLSVADLLYSITCLVEVMNELLFQCTWRYGVFMCKTLQSLLVLSGNIDLGFILGISIERYIGIVHPFNSFFSAPERTRQMIILNVVISILTVLPVFIDYDVVGGICAPQRSVSSQRAYTWCLLVVFFLVPVLIISYLSFRSVKALKETVCKHDMLSSMNERARLRLLAENKEIMRLLVLLLIAFVIFVLPNRLILVIIANMDPESLSASSFLIMRLFGTITYPLHAAVNPIIYSLTDKRFRKSSMNIICCGKGDTNCEDDISKACMTKEETCSTPV